VARARRRGGRLGAREAAACHRVPWAVTARSVHARGSRPTVEGGRRGVAVFLRRGRGGKEWRWEKNWGPGTLLMGERGGLGSAWCDRRSGGPAGGRRAGTVEAVSSRRGRGPPHVVRLGGATKARGLLLWARPIRTVTFSIYSKELQKEAT
jgi:hypothetical protein